MVTASHAQLMIPLLTYLRISYFDGIVAAHAVVRTLQPFATQSPFGGMVGIYTLKEATNTLGISLGT